MTDDKKLNAEEMKKAAGGERPISGSEVPSERPVLEVDDLHRVDGGTSSATSTSGAHAAGGSFRPTLDGDIVDGDTRSADISPV